MESYGGIIFSLVILLLRKEPESDMQEDLSIFVMFVLGPPLTPSIPAASLRTPLVWLKFGASLSLIA